jgi:hypothetical protein
MPQVLERGNIYFAYRPRVEETSAAGIEDVERFSVIFTDLHMEQREHLKLLFEGKWQLLVNPCGWVGLAIVAGAMIAASKRSG